MKREGEREREREKSKTRGKEGGVPQEEEKEGLERNELGRNGLGALEGCIGFEGQDCWRIEHEKCASAFLCAYIVSFLSLKGYFYSVIQSSSHP